MKLSIQLILFLSFIWAVPMSQASVKWYMCTNDLAITLIRSPRVESRWLTYLDHLGIEHKEPIDELFFVLPDRRQTPDDQSTTENDDQVIVTLTDDQRFGAVILESQEPDRMRFVTRFDSTPRSVSLGSIVSVARQSTRPDVPTARNDDTLLLLNNDLISGYIESIGQSVIIDSGTDPVDTRSIEMKHVQLITLANNRSHRSGSYLHLLPNTRLYVQGINTSPTEPGTAGPLQFEPEGASQPDQSVSLITIDSQQFAGLDMKYAHLELVPLTDLKPSKTEATGGRMWTPSPIVLPSTIPHSTLDDLDLRAPIKLEYTLDPGMVRFACHADLVVGRWSDCTLVIQTHAKDSPNSNPARYHLNRQNPDTEIIIDLPARSTKLTLWVDPGDLGPIQDRIILRKPRLLKVIPAGSSQFE